jgi:spore maturation protein CgeB
VLDPARELGLTGAVHGVRYPPEALQAVAESGLRFGGWAPNFLVPSIFASHRFTVHVPRGPYVRALAGIPTIRPFEALACGIPLISAPWEDREKLFRPGEDFLVAQDGEGMKRAIRMLRDDPALGEHLAAHGLSTIRARHTCAHRVDELLAICAALDVTTSPRIYA